MIKLYTEEQFKNAKSKEKLLLQCKQCQKSFLKFKNEIQKIIAGRKNLSGEYCSNQCKYNSQDTKIKLNCKHCNKEIYKTPCGIRLNNFCSRSCSAYYSNSHKTKGFNRSKFELWAEKKLKTNFPNLDLLFNDQKTLKYELDIFIPSLKLAFEINGIFHYKNIYGEKRFQKIIYNDNQKQKLCKEKNINLNIIDISSQNTFKEKTHEKYLLIIIDKIKYRLKSGDVGELNPCVLFHK